VEVKGVLGTENQSLVPFDLQSQLDACVQLLVALERLVNAKRLRTILAPVRCSSLRSNTLWRSKGSCTPHKASPLFFYKNDRSPRIRIYYIYHRCCYDSRPWIHGAFREGSYSAPSPSGSRRGAGRLFRIYSRPHSCSHISLYAHQVPQSLPPLF